MTAVITGSSQVYKLWVRDNHVNEKEFPMVQRERDVFGRTFKNYMLIHGFNSIEQKELHAITEYLNIYNAERIYRID